MKLCLKLKMSFIECLPMYVSRVSIIMYPCEAGIECFVKHNSTPDSRPGILI